MAATQDSVAAAMGELDIGGAYSQVIAACDLLVGVSRVSPSDLEHVAALLEPFHPLLAARARTRVKQPTPPTPVAP
jgi:hypothetical protein